MIDWANRIIEKYNSVHNWLSTKDKYGWQRSAKIIIGALVAIVILQLIGVCARVTYVATLCLLLLLVNMLLLFVFDAEDKRISRIKRMNCNKPRELFGKMNHWSYLYGLVFFVLEITIYLMIIVILVGAVFGVALSYFSLNIFLFLWMAGMFVYTFLYFAYHMRHLNKEKTIKKVKQMLQLYAARGATISFGMILLGENFLIKVFVVGTLLEYTWLQYFITKEYDS